MKNALLKCFLVLVLEQYSLAAGTGYTMSRDLLNYQY